MTTADLEQALATVELLTRTIQLYAFHFTEGDNVSDTAIDILQEADSYFPDSRLASKAREALLEPRLAAVELIDALNHGCRFDGFEANLIQTWRHQVDDLRALHRSRDEQNQVVRR
jgi:hypothetical protein